jgi:hypothetical protein
MYFTSRQKIDGNAQPRKCHYWGAQRPYPWFKVGRWAVEGRRAIARRTEAKNN